MAWDTVDWRIGLHERPSVLQIGVGIHRVRGIERYRLPGLWCAHLYRYHATLLIDGAEFPIRPGFASIIPPDTAMEFRFADEQPVHVYVHFAIRDTRGPRTPIRAMQDLGDRFLASYRAFEEAVGMFSNHPRRAEVRIWDLLWQLTDAGREIPNHAFMPRGDRVQAARELIEQRLGQRLRVAKLAREVGLSHNHLTRRFRASVGMTISRYIQERRMQRAKHLLIHSTLPIKTIAADVGIPDPHLFNKTVRRLLGRSPSAIRDGAEIAGTE